MTTPIDRLEEYVKKATKRPWRQSDGTECSDAIVSGPADESYYGGQVVAESVDLPDIDLIVAAVNALPDLLKVARVADVLGRQAHGGSPIEGWLASIAELRAALEPLFHEETRRGD